MKFEDLVIQKQTVGIPVTSFRIKNEYFYPTGGIDFNKVLEPIDNIGDCTVSFDYDVDKRSLFILSSSGYIRLSAHNYENHKEIMDEILRQYFSIYKSLDSYYKSLTDEEKLKLELE